MTSRSIGKMQRKQRSKPSSEKRGLRQKVAVRPTGKKRYQNGKYQKPGTTEEQT